MAHTDAPTERTGVDHVRHAWHIFISLLDPFEDAGRDPDKLEISASNPDQGEASEEIEAKYSGDVLSIGFNARYLMDVLNAHAQGDDIELGLTDEVGPGILKGAQDPSYTYVVMPMRL